MTFELTAHDKGTVLTFHHEGWKATGTQIPLQAVQLFPASTMPTGRLEWLVPRIQHGEAFQSANGGELPGRLPQQQ